jgi:serine/threonine protein kinase/WD40 repeat protein
MNEYPTLDSAAVDALVGQIADEFTQRLNQGEHPDAGEYVRRHPEIGGVLRDVLAALEMVRVASPELAAAPAAEPAAPVHGCLGDFRILREVGRGGMGVVYEAEQISLSRPVALKILPFAATLDPKQLQRFKNEAQAAAHLHHQNIVPVYAVGCERGVHYYAMQLVPGQTLASVIDELRDQASSGRAGPAHHPTPHVAAPEQITERSTANPAFFRTVAEFGVQAAQALEHAHQLGVVHRDIKPANLLVDDRRHLWITDFGLARLQGDTGLTLTGDMVGTLRYMSPEQALGPHTQVDQRTDIYSLGATLYEVMTLEPAVRGSERHELLRAIAEEEPRLPRRHNRNIPEDLETIALKAMAKSVTERYGTAQELADDLQRFLTDQPIRARRPSWLQYGKRWARRHRPVLVAAAIAVLAVLLVAIGLLALNNAHIRDEERRTARERDKAITAERERTEQLRQSLLTQAQARRLRRQAGQRFAALDVLGKAAAIARSLDQADPALLQLRNEAIACLALVDVQPERTLHAAPANESWQAFDRDFTHHAWSDRDGTITIAAVAGMESDVRLRGPEQSPRWVGLLFSPDGRWLAAQYDLAGRPSVLCIWNTADHKRVAVALESEGTKGLAFSPDSRWLASSRGDSTVGLYNPATGVLRHALGDNLGNALDLAFAPDASSFYDVPVKPIFGRVFGFHPTPLRLAVSTRYHKLALVFDAISRRQLAALEHPAATDGICWTDGGGLLAVGCNDQRIYVWKLATQRLQAVLGGHCNAGIGVDAPVQGSLLASRSLDGTTRLWDPVQGRLLVSALGHLVAVRGDGQQLALWRDGQLKLCTVADGRECRTLHHGRIGTHTARPPDWGPRSVDFSADGRLLASASHDGVRIWESTGNCRELAHLVIGDTSAAWFVHGDAPGLITSTERALFHWPLAVEFKAGISELRLGPPRTVIALDGPAHHAIGLSRDGHWLALADPSKNGAVLLDLKSGGRQAQFGPLPRIERVAVSPDGKWLAAAGQNAPVTVWDTVSGEPAWQLPAAPGRPRLAFSPDGQWLVTSALERVVRFWRVGNWSAGPVVDMSEKATVEVAFSPDGTLLAAADFTRGIKLLDPATGRERALLEAAEDNTITCLSFSPDGSQLAAATNNHTVHLWDLRALRRQLQMLDLDWDIAPVPPPRPAIGPFRAQVLPGKYRDSAFVSLGVHEAENLPVVDSRHCSAKPQPTGYWTRPDRRWSNGAHLFCKCTQQGAFAELEVTVPATAEYQLEIYFTRAPDYGQVQVAIDGKPVGSVFDGFYHEVAPAGQLAVGNVDLRQGTHRLRFTSVGKNERSTGWHMGVDCLELVPVR